MDKIATNDSINDSFFQYAMKNTSPLQIQNKFIVRRRHNFFGFGHMFRCTKNIVKFVRFTTVTRVWIQMEHIHLHYDV